MKKYLLLAIVLISTLASFANPWDIKSQKKDYVVKVWDQPLYSTKRTTPVINFTTLTVSQDHSQMVVSVTLSQPGIDDGHNWKAEIPCSVYGYFMVYGQGLPHREWKWVTIIYECTVQSGAINGVNVYNLYNQEQFNTIYSDHTGPVEEDQYYIWQWYAL